MFDICNGDALSQVELPHWSITNHFYITKVNKQFLVSTDNTIYLIGNNIINKVIYEDHENLQKPIVKILKIGDEFKALFRDSTHITFNLENDDVSQVTKSLSDHITKNDS